MNEFAGKITDPENRGLVVAVLVVIIIVLSILLFKNAREYKKTQESMVQGMWIGDSDFMKESGIDSMYLYIGPVIGRFTSRKRYCYMILIDDGDVVFNKKMRMSTGGSTKNIFKQTVFVDSSEDPTEDTSGIMPDKLSLTLNIGSGIMTLENDGTTYGVLYKDLIGTASNEVGEFDINESDA